MSAVSTLTPKLATEIYLLCYGHLDDKDHRARLLAEIRDWLIEGETVTALAPADLALLWRDYVAESGDPDIRLKE